MGRVKEETLRGAKWGVIQKCTMQPVQFLYGIILARLIGPEDMGILGLTAIFFAIAGQLKDGGFGSALIRKQDRTEEDCSTVFWYNVLISLFLSLLLFWAAPWLAEFYHQPPLVELTRVSAGLMFLNSTVSVHQALFSARRDFKTPAIISMSCTLVAMPFTIWAAFAGWSYWAPMLQGIISSLLSLIAIWICSPWKPRLVFSCHSFREFFSYGSRLMLSGLITTVYAQSRTFIIGKFYSASQLAFFSKGYRTCSLPMQLTLDTMSGVTFPILSTIQHDESRLLGVYRQYIRITSLVIEWVMVTVAANSRSIMLTLYGEQWLPCAFYAQLLCFGIMLDPLYNINGNLCMVKGRTDITLRREVILRCFGLTSMLVGAYYSVAAVCLAGVLTGVFACLLSLYLTSRICALTMRQQLSDFVPYLLMALGANIPAYLFNLQEEFLPVVALALGVVSSLALYVTFLCMRRDQAAAQLLQLVQEKGLFRKLCFWKRRS